MIRFLERLFNKAGDKTVKIDIKHSKDWIIKNKSQYKSFNSQDLLNLISDFYLNHRIRKVDYREPDSDMLLYQYGNFSRNERNDFFYLNITRQVMIGMQDENFYHISINLIYNKNAELDIKSSNKWCNSKDELNNWIEFIKASDIYKLSIGQEPISIEIDVSKV